MRPKTPLRDITFEMVVHISVRVPVSGNADRDVEAALKKLNHNMKPLLEDGTIEWASDPVAVKGKRV